MLGAGPIPFGSASGSGRRFLPGGKHCATYGIRGFYLCIREYKVARRHRLWCRFLPGTPVLGFGQRFSVLLSASGKMENTCPITHWLGLFYPV